MHNPFKRHLKIVPVPKGKVVRLNDYRLQASQSGGILHFVEIRDRHGRFQGIEPRWMPLSGELRGRFRMMAEGRIR